MGGSAVVCWPHPLASEVSPFAPFRRQDEDEGSSDVDEATTSSSSSSIGSESSGSGDEEEEEDGEELDTLPSLRRDLGRNRRGLFQSFGSSSGATGDSGLIVFERGSAGADTNATSTSASTSNTRPRRGEAAGGGARAKTRFVLYIQMASHPACS